MLGFALLGVVSVSGIQQTKSSQALPLPGGIYREAVITTSPRELEKNIEALTHIGLVRRDDQGSLLPGVAESWQINENATQLTVTLRPEVPASKVKELLDQQTESGYWDDALYETPDERTIIFLMSQPWSTYIFETTAPIFPFGPYTVTATDSDGQVHLRRNPTALYPPYLEEIDLLPFLDVSSVDRPIRKSQIDGLFTSTMIDLELPSSWTLTHPRLDGEFVLFLNTKQASLATIDRRQALLADATLIGQSFRLVVPEIPDVISLALDFQKQAEARGAEIKIEQYPVLTIQRIIQERDYDLLLLGIDDGPGDDLYPYWHSSQIAAPGQNFAGFRDKEVDRLLDETRFHQDAAERQARSDRILSILESQAVMKSFGSPTVTLARSQEIEGALPEELSQVQDRWALIDTWYSKQRIGL